MVDLAELGIRVRSEEAEVAENRLDDLAMAAGRAETAEERLAAAARGTGSAMASQNVALRQRQRVMDAVRGATGLTSHETLNLGRQFADVGVSLASGQAIWMVAIQQGAQIGEVFAEARTRGVGLSAAIRSIMASAAPLLAVLLPIAAVVGTVAAGFGLLHREMSKGYPDDLTRGMGLTAEQLDRVKTKTVTFGDTLQATFNVIGRHIMDGPVGQALNWLGDKVGEVMDWITKQSVENWAIIGGVIVGTYRTVVETWKMFPAALGELVTNATNNVLRAAEEMINGVIGRLNGFIAIANLIPGVALQRLSKVDLPELEQRFEGASAAIGSSLLRNVGGATDEMRAGLRGIGAEIGTEAERLRRAQIIEEAGKRNKGAKEGVSPEAREYKRLMEAGEAYRLGLIKERETLGMTAQERRAYEAQAQADILIKKGQTDAARDLAQRILDEAKALDTATAAYQRSEVMKEFGRDIQYLELERDLLNATNVERARQLAILRQEFLIRDRLGKQADVYIASPEGQAEMTAAGNVGAKRVENGEALSDAQKLTRELGLVNDLARDAGRGMADAFGEAGGALADLLTGMTSYRVAMDDIATRQRENHLDATQAARERASVELQTYGDMASAAKGFFEEGSTGYRILMAVEQAYRFQQFAMSIQAMALGKAEAASSVADSATKGAAAQAAGAAKIFESLGPLGFPMVAAMIALLASLGLRGGGGGGKGKSSVSDSVATAQSFGTQATRARDTATSAMASKMEVVVTADRDGLKAYVRSEAADVAAPMARSAAQAGTVGGASTALTSMQGVQRRNYRLG